MKSLQINNTSVLPPHLRYFAWMQFTTTDGCLFLSRSLKAILNGQQHTMARFANRNGVEWLHTQGGEPEALTNIDLEGIPVFKHDPELLAENWLYTSEPHRVWNHWIGPNPPFPTEPAISTITQDTVTPTPITTPEEAQRFIDKASESVDGRKMLKELAQACENEMSTVRRSRTGE